MRMCMCVYIYIYLYIYIIIIHTYKLIYIISYSDREASKSKEEFLWKKEKRKNHKSRSLLFWEVFCEEVNISGLELNRVRSHLSLLKGLELYMGLFLVPDYPILCGTKAQCCRKCGRSVVYFFFFLLHFFSQAPANFFVQYSHLVIEYIHSVLFLLLHITLTA